MHSSRMRTGRSYTTVCWSLLPGEGGVCSGGGAWSGGICSGGVCSVGVCSRGGIPACIEAEPPPVNRMTNRCKNITLATTSLRPVIKAQDLAFSNLQNILTLSLSALYLIPISSRSARLAASKSSTLFNSFCKAM